MKGKIVVSFPIHSDVQTYLESFSSPDINDTENPWPRAEFLRRCTDAAGIMVFMTDRIDAMFIQACSNLKIIAGALKGYDNIDVETCRQRSVWLTNVPNLLSTPTAELALSLLLGLARRLREGDAAVRSGFQGWRPCLYGTSIEGSTIGIIGFGSVGQAFAKLLLGFDVEILCYDPHPPPQKLARTLRVENVSFDELIARSQIITPFVHLTNDTLHLINANTLNRIKPGALLVNCGRGSVVDETAVAQSLAGGHLGGYAADVFEMEDQSRADAPKFIPAALLSHPRTLFTPHRGSAVETVRLAIERTAAEQLHQAFTGIRPTLNVF